MRESATAMSHIQTARGRRIFYDQSGTGPPVLLIPGLGGVSALMVGRCGPRGADVPTLWVAGPAQ